MNTDIYCKSCGFNVPARQLLRHNQLRHGGSRPIPQDGRHISDRFYLSQFPEEAVKQFIGLTEGVIVWQLDKITESNIIEYKKLVTTETKTLILANFNKANRVVQWMIQSLLSSGTIGSWAYSGKTLIIDTSLNPLIKQYI